MGLLASYIYFRGKYVEGDMFSCKLNWEGSNMRGFLGLQNCNNDSDCIKVIDLQSCCDGCNAGHFKTINKKYLDYWNCIKETGEWNVRAKFKPELEINCTSVICQPAPSSWECTQKPRCNPYNHICELEETYLE